MNSDSKIDKFHRLCRLSRGLASFVAFNCLCDLMIKVNDIALTFHTQIFRKLETIERKIFFCWINDNRKSLKMIFQLKAQLSMALLPPCFHTITLKDCTIKEFNSFALFARFAFLCFNIKTNLIQFWCLFLTLLFGYMGGRLDVVSSSVFIGLTINWIDWRLNSIL